MVFRKKNANDIRCLVHASGPAPDVHKPIRVFVSVPDLRQVVLDSAWRELVAWRDRYDELNEFSELFPTIDKVIAKVKKKGGKSTAKV